MSKCRFILPLLPVLCSGLWSNSLRAQAPARFDDFTQIGVPLSSVGGFTIADFDDNGLNDFAVYGGSAVVVMLQTSPMVFSTGSSTILPSSTSNERIASGDWDGDGDTDVAISLVAGGFAVLENDGAGALSVSQTLSSITAIGEVFHVLDFNKDGALDICVGGGIFRNNGFGNFSFTAGFSPESIDADVWFGLLDSNTNPDVIMVNRTSFTVYHEDAVLNPFTGKEIVYPFPTPDLVNSEPLLVGDVTGDGLRDVVMFPSIGERAIEVWEANSTGGLRPLSLPVPRSEYYIDNANLSDLDGDGDLDLVGRSSGITRILVYINDGRGEFKRHGIYTGPIDGRLQAADIDGDRNIDIVGRALSAEPVPTPVLRIFLNKGGAEFSGAKAFPTPYSLSNNVLVPGNFNEGSNLDLWLGGQFFLEGLGRGDYREKAANFSTTLSTDRAVKIDLNKDGLDDAVFGSSQSSNTLGVMRNQGDWNFLRVAVDENLYPATGGVLTSLSTAHFDGGPYRDIVYPVPDGLMWRANNTDGTLSFPTFISLIPPGQVNGPTPFSVASGELNDTVSDFADDLVLAGNKLVRVRYDFPDSIDLSTEQLPVVPDAGEGWRHVAILDAGSDQDPDIVVTNTDGRAYVWRNTLSDNSIPRSGFAYVDRFPLGWGDPHPRGIQAIDFNGDGDDDLLVAPPSDSAKVGINISNGNNTFQTPQFVYVAFTRSVPVAFDADGDGDPDVASTDVYGASILRNDLFILPDNVPPSSQVRRASQIAGTLDTNDFHIYWSAYDPFGSTGVASVTLYYRRNGGDWSSLAPTLENPIPINIATLGSAGNYEFYTTSVDRAGSVEAAPTVADLSIALGEPFPVASVSLDGTLTAGENYETALNFSEGIDTCRWTSSQGENGILSRMGMARGSSALNVFLEGRLAASNKLIVLLDSDADDSTGVSGPIPTEGIYEESQALEGLGDIADGGWDTVVIVGTSNEVPANTLYATILTYTAVGGLNAEQYVGSGASPSASFPATVRGASGALGVSISSSAGTDRGMEISIPSAWLPVSLTGRVRALAFISNANATQLSNQSIPESRFGNDRRISGERAFVRLVSPLFQLGAPPPNALSNTWLIY